MAVIDDWRKAHRHVLNSFQSILNNRVKGTSVVVAQRHKRRKTIFDKLNRHPKMQLSRMSDVAGCRLIFDSLQELNDFRLNFHLKSHFQHKMKNSKNKYNYILRPKPNGYRGIHDVYEYGVKSQASLDKKGLLIELQYRTKCQHAWATAVEMVEFLTADQPKFDRGSKKIREALLLSSEIIARAHEDTYSALPDIDNRELLDRFIRLDKNLHFLKMLRGLNAVDKKIANQKGLILIVKKDHPDSESALEVKTYPSAPQALRKLFKLERDYLDLDPVLVKSQRPGDVREAFRNFFSDASQFIHLVEDGCHILAGSKLLTFSS